MVRPENVFEFGDKFARGAAAIPLQPALESGARDIQRCRRRVRCRAATYWRRSRPLTAFPLRPSRPCSWRDPSHNRSAVLPVRSRSSLQRMGLVVFPVRALVMIVGAQEIMHALRRAVHVGVGLARRIVPLIMFARPRQCRELAMHGILRASASAARPRCLERQRRRTCERRAHQRDRSEHIGPHQRAPCRDRSCRNRARSRHRHER